MYWEIDERTAKAATGHPLRIDGDVPAPQFGGCRTDAETWNDRVIQPSSWPEGPLQSGPDQIIKEFRDERHTQALALVVSWGGMGRRSKDIYGERRRETVEQIDRTLLHCAQSIRESQSIADSWRQLTKPGDGRRGWSAVMASKTLHFLCRSLGFEQEPPVPIDNAVIRQRVWPAFRNSIPSNERPDNWEGNSFEAYRRYMTAVLVWARRKNWTTTEM